MMKQHNDVLEQWVMRHGLKKDGTQRRMGIEIEYSNLSLQKSCEIVQELYGGAIEEQGRFKRVLKNTELGDFTFELDSQLLQKIDNKNMVEQVSELFSSEEKVLEKVLDKTAQKFIPYEIAMPPLAFSKLYLADELAGLLRMHGALGTTRAFQYAFGMHINIEPASTDVQTVLRLFQSFFILQEWIEQQSDLDVTRQITPFLNGFSSLYLKLIMDPAYRPDKREFINDYIAYNPTRNRVVDMLPLLAFWDETTVRKSLMNEKINARPTFHYRVPNSKIDQFRWYPSQEWRLWAVVEMLADNPEMMNRMLEGFRHELTSLLPGSETWVQRTHTCVLELLNA